MTMLWQKSWLDTRWRFVIGFALLACGAVLAVLWYPRVTRLVAAAAPIDTSTEVGRRLSELLDITRGFRGYVWTQWFRQTARQCGVLFAILLGSGGLVAHAGTGELYTLSLPMSRRDLLTARAVTGLVELFLITFVPALTIAALAPAVGERYAFGAALTHAACLFAACAALFALALLLSTSYGDTLRPMVIALVVVFAMALIETGYPPFRPYSALTLMSGESYFRTGEVPWLGLTAAIAFTAALLATASVNLARRDY